MADAPILTTEELVCGYDAPLLEPVDLEVPDGEFVLVEGPNGIGKSTLLKTLIGLQPELSGSYEWAVDRRDRRFVPQVRTLDPILPATVVDVVATGAQIGSGFEGLRHQAGEEEVDRVLGRVEMTGYASELFRELSEGQKQLVLLARALMGKPRAMVLDEPTASMDPERESRAMEILETECSERGAAIFVVAHGSTPAREAASRILAIDRNRRVKWRDSGEEHHLDH